MNVGSALNLPHVAHTPEIDQQRIRSEEFNWSPYANATKNMGPTSGWMFYKEYRKENPRENPPKEKKGHDHGTGAGRDVTDMKKEGLDVTALDPCPAILEVAKNWDKDITVVNSKLEHAGLKGSNFWTTNSQNVLGFFNDDEAVQELQRIKLTMHERGDLTVSFFGDTHEEARRGTVNVLGENVAAYVRDMPQVTNLMRKAGLNACS